ncbi:MAG: MBL fold metallo-hydrolase, partial [Thaumarchaeota archaeon]|nr:MBL fold metallo-hydrolase [Nitrososphaerota archaeon]
MRLNILDGINSIGGNKIALIRNDEGILLDFGVNMKKKREYILGYRALTIANKLYYYLYSEILPRIEGLYREDLLELDERVREVLKKRKRLEIQMCIISHAHIDHYGAAGFLSKEIKISVSNSMRTMMEAMIEASATLDIDGEIFSMRDRRTGRRGERIQRNVESFEEGSKIPEAPFNVLPYPVDHSLPASFGFIVEDASLAYTGDIRRHGLFREFTDRFVQKARDVEYLLTEGTRVDSSIRVSEEEVSREIRSYVNEKKDMLTCIVVSPTDMDRLRDLTKLAEELGKKLVICPKIVHLIDKLNDSETKIALPSLK